MYAESFGLSAEPFAPTPDPAFLYRTPQHRDAIAALEYGLRERRGFVTLVGEVGTGKTTILYTLLESLGDSIDSAYLTHTTLSYDELLRAALVDLGVADPGRSKGELIATLNRFLHDQSDQGRVTALVIDEAQNLTLETLEELRLLTDYETFQHKLLQIVLVGQPELDQRLADPKVRQLRDRIAIRARLAPLHPSEVHAYIDHRLRIVGGSIDASFSRAAIAAVAKLSQGNPRRINTLCHNALLVAYARGVKRVSRAFVQQAMDEWMGTETTRSEGSRWDRLLDRIRPRESSSPVGRGLLGERRRRLVFAGAMLLTLTGALQLTASNRPASYRPPTKTIAATPVSLTARVRNGLGYLLDVVLPQDGLLEEERRRRGYRGE